LILYQANAPTLTSLSKDDKYMNEKITMLGNL